MLQGVSYIFIGKIKNKVLCDLYFFSQFLSNIANFPICQAQAIL